jgi:hypothetical protein
LGLVVFERKKKIKERTTCPGHFKSPKDLIVFMKEGAKHCSFIQGYGIYFIFLRTTVMHQNGFFDFF